MDRRAFLKSGSFGLGGLMLGGASMTAMVQEAIAAAAASGEPWKFGVMADTQWPSSASAVDPWNNPATCAVGIIESLNQRFIGHGVKFVVQVGDLVDKEYWTIPGVSGYADPFGHTAGTTNVRSLKYRELAAQTLYNAGIGFFPLRGNHEGTSTAANELAALFPQTTGGGSNLFGVSNVVNSSISGLVGLSYAFDFGNVRIVMLDQFTRRDGTGSTNNNMLDQVNWVDQTLANRSSDTHAFVMGHKNLIGQNHADCLFGSNATTNLGYRDSFISSLQANKTGYYMGGHDHMHHRSLIANSAGSAKVEQIIGSSNSYKFYIPKSTPNDTTARESVVAQELFSIGYYIFTVDGPSVTVDFYSASHGANYGDLDLSLTPNLNYFRRERFGYSLNGKEFVVANGQSYNSVQDSYNGTTARILDGQNEDTASDADYNGREQVKTIRTGWRERPAGAASAVLKLWGLANNLALWEKPAAGIDLSGMLPGEDADTVGDTFVLSLAYDRLLVRPSQLGTGFCLAAKDQNGNWVNAVDLNAGGTRKLVIGRWKSGYPLGTYGIDPTTHSVWAVLNRDGEFVARTV